MNRVHFQVKAQRWCQDEILGDPVSYNKCQFQNLSRNPELVIEKKSTNLVVISFVSKLFCRLLNRQMMRGPCS